MFKDDKSGILAVGDVIFSLPEGNYVKRGVKIGQQIECWSCAKTARLYATLRRDPAVSLGYSRSEIEIDMKSGRVRNALNAGYLFFRSEKSLNDYLYAAKILPKIVDRVTFSRHAPSCEQIRKIAEILEIGVESDE